MKENEKRKANKKRFKRRKSREIKIDLNSEKNVLQIIYYLYLNIIEAETFKYIGEQE